jgi:predicted ester cyclase
MNTKQTQPLTRRHFLQVLGLSAASTSLVGLPFITRAQSATSTETLEQNKAVSRQFVEHINAKDLEGAFALIDNTFVNHTAGPEIPEDRGASKGFFSMLFAGFPDVHTTILDIIAEGDKVVRFSKVEGTNTGEFMGMPATGNKASWLLIDIDRIVDGKIVEHWDVSDNLGMMQQLGMIPSQ